MKDGIKIIESNLADANNADVFQLRITPEHIIGKKLVDIYWDEHENELQFIFEGGKQVEILLARNGKIDIQTD